MGEVDKRIRVIEFIESMGDGGAETLVKDYALMIDKTKFDLKILVLKDDGFSANMDIIKKNNISLLKVLPDWYSQTFKFVTRHMKNYTKDVYIVKRLRQILLDEKPDVLHVHLNLLAYVEKITDLLKETKIFYTCHSELWVHLEGEEAEAARRLCQLGNFRMIALHNKMREQLNEMFAVNNTIVIHNAINFERFRYLKINTEFKRREIGIPQDAFVIGHVGRFVEQKNHGFLVKVFLQLLKQTPNAFLLMIGDGSSKDIKKITKILEDGGGKDKYKILNHRTDVNELMRIMDVFVFPSLYEGLGIVAIEAQVSGLKCIIADTVPKEASISNSTVYLSLDDVQQWVDVILDIDTYEIKYNNLSDWDMNKEIRVLESLYLQLI